MFRRKAKFEYLLGKTIVRISGLDKGSELVILETEDRSFKMYHETDCCETVRIEEIVGDVSDIIGSKILLAEEVISVGQQNEDLSQTWTFYKLSTIKGSITIRWLGESNGYYSEQVEFIEIGVKE